MTDPAKHAQQAERNEQFFIRSLSPSSFFDWSVTALFYSALHYVDAYLARLNIHPSSHKDRNWRVAQLPSLRRVRQEYMHLLDRSIDARYNLVAFNEQFVEGL